MINKLNARNTISSKEGIVFATINGQNIPFIELKEMTAKWVKNKQELQAIGSRIVKNKTTSLKGEGHLAGYVIRSKLITESLQFKDGGADLYFSINYTAEDTNSNAGREQGLLSGVNLNEIPLINLLADDGVLEWESDFTFEDSTPLESLNTL